MFIAALLDAFTDRETSVLETIHAATVTSPVTCELVRFKDPVLQGRRFRVAAATSAHSSIAVRIPFARDTAEHSHTSWSTVRNNWRNAEIPAAVREQALGIFGCLAEAEAAEHGVALEQVTFREVGAWDSIVDIVGAAALIEGTRDDSARAAAGASASHRKAVAGRGVGVRDR